MYQSIPNHNISANVESSYSTTLKLEVNIANHKLIPSWSWVDDVISTQIPHNTTQPAFYTQSSCLWYVHGARFYNTTEFSAAANHDETTTLNWFLAYGNSLPSKPDDVRQLPVEYKS